MAPEVKIVFAIVGIMIIWAACYGIWANGQRKKNIAKMEKQRDARQSKQQSMERRIQQHAERISPTISTPAVKRAISARASSKPVVRESGDKAHRQSEPVAVHHHHHYDVPDNSLSNALLVAAVLTDDNRCEEKSLPEPVVETRCEAPRSYSEPTPPYSPPERSYSEPTYSEPSRSDSWGGSSEGVTSSWD